MAINKKLIHFLKKENFENEVANGNILDNSIVFIKDTKEISTHGTIYKTINWSVLKDYSDEYFTIEALENNLKVKITYNNFLYKIDNKKNWITLKAGKETISINQGLRIFFKGNPTIKSEAAFDRWGIGNFTISKKCNVSGNIMSLLYGDDFKEQYDLTSKEYCFNYLFKDCTNIISAKNLILPAITLSHWCYAQMFLGCTSLTTAPNLLAPILASGCYHFMFQNCKLLNYIKMLAVSKPYESCLRGWTTNVSNTGTFVKHPDMTTLYAGDDGIPNNWEILNDGEKPKNIIIFTIQDVEYQAEEGMTWAEWVNSEYNTLKCTIDELLYVVFQDGNYCVGLINGKEVVSTDIIEELYPYFGFFLDVSPIL